MNGRTNSEQDTCNKKLIPVLAHSRSNDSEKAEDGGEEDDSSTTEPVVKRIGAPAATDFKLDEFEGLEVGAETHMKAEPM